MSAKPRLSAYLFGDRKVGASHAMAGRPAQPVQIWTWIGSLLLVVEIWFMAKWIGSEHFVSVPSGPDVPPHCVPRRPRARAEPPGR